MSDGLPCHWTLRSCLIWNIEVDSKTWWTRLLPNSPYESCHNWLFHGYEFYWKQKKNPILILFLLYKMLLWRIYYMLLQMTMNLKTWISRGQQILTHPPMVVLIGEPEHTRNNYLRLTFQPKVLLKLSCFHNIIVCLSKLLYRWGLWTCYRAKYLNLIILGSFWMEVSLPPSLSISYMQLHACVHVLLF